MKDWKKHTISELAEMIKYLNQDLIKNPDETADRLRQLAFKISSK